MSSFYYARRRSAGFNPATLSNLLACLLSENVQHTGSATTGWLDTVTNQVLPLGGAYTAANPNFNNKPTVTLASGDLRLPGITIPAGVAGFTATFVAQSTPSPQDSMWWYMTDGTGELDLWRAGGNQLGLNTFNGDCYGIQLDSQTRPVVVTVAVPDKDIKDAHVYVNGQQRAIPPNNPRQHGAAGTFYFASVPSTPSYNFRGDSSDFFLQAGLASAQEVSQLHTYLQTKNGL
ncbi:MAG: hypothetical protein ACRYFX_12945 [Janthinobacterium lividum]